LPVLPVSHRRNVVLTLGIEGMNKIIEVRNTCNSIAGIDTARIFNRGYSTKEGKHRVYGLYNAKRIVDIYHGAMELSFDEQYIVFKVLFY
jgi:two-component system sensor histidine kinase AgrC